MSDAFGDRMKVYEGRESQRRSLPRLPVIVRVDGKGFSKWTKGLRRPFDERIHKLMVETTKVLVKETNATVGYTQSDEISLVLYAPERTSQLYCDGRYQKLASIVASTATAHFNAMVPKFLPEREGRLAVFDARVWDVPDTDEAANAILWREIDATKNSISMAARSVYSHKEILGKSGKEMQQMLLEKGINWNDYPAWARRGTYVQRVTVTRKYTPEEIANLPAKHDAKNGGSCLVQRSTIAEVNEASLLAYDRDEREEFVLNTHRVANMIGKLEDM